VQILRNAQTFVRRIAFEPLKFVEDSERRFALVTRVVGLGPVRDGLEFPAQRRHAQVARSTIAAGIAFGNAPVGDPPFEHAIIACKFFGFRAQAAAHEVIVRAYHFA